MSQMSRVRNARPLPLRPERAAPRVGLVGRVVLHVQRLHRRADVLGGEPRQVVVLQRLNVLDPVHAARDGPCRPVRVECGAHGAVAHRVGRAREAGAGEAGDDGGVAFLGRPERHRAAAVGVWLVQPRGAGLDDAVDEELGGPAAPHLPALAEQRQTGRDLVVGDVRLLVQRHDAAGGHPAARVHLAAHLEQLRRPDHHVPAGEPDGVHPLEGDR